MYRIVNLGGNMVKLKNYILKNINEILPLIIKYDKYEFSQISKNFPNKYSKIVETHIKSEKYFLCYKIDSVIQIDELTHYILSNRNHNIEATEHEINELLYKLLNSIILFNEEKNIELIKSRVGDLINSIKHKNKYQFIKTIPWIKADEIIPFGRIIIVPTIKDLILKYNVPEEDLNTFNNIKSINSFVHKVHVIIDVNAISYDIASIIANNILQLHLNALTLLYNQDFLIDGNQFSIFSQNGKWGQNLLIGNAEKKVSTFLKLNYYITDNKQIIERLNKILSADKPCRLDLKIRNSIWWYGEAFKEKNNSLKLVKIIIAFESLLLDGERNHNDVIRDRASILFSKLPLGRIESGRLIDEAYSLRNDIVHGGDTDSYLGNYFLEKLLSILKQVIFNLMENNTLDRIELIKNCVKNEKDNCLNTHE